jgi:hypothetical protein
MLAGSQWMTGVLVRHKKMKNGRALRRQPGMHACARETGTGVPLVYGTEVPLVYTPALLSLISLSFPRIAKAF